MVAAALPARSVPDLVTIDGSKMRLNFHSGQRRAWRSTKRFVCVIAGSQSGKTSFGPHWLRREIAMKGPGDYMVVTPTFPLLEIKALPEFLRLFRDQLNLGTYRAAPPRHFELSTEGEIRMFGAPQDVKTIVWFGYAADPDSLEAATVKGIWGDEAGQPKFRLASWGALNRRGSLNQARTLLTTTPYNLGWLFTEIWKPWQAAGGNHPYIDVINFESIANPAFPQEEFERLRETMPEWQFSLFHRGIFTRPAGLIYDNFDEKCVIKPFKLPDHWPRHMGVDFGGVNTAALFAAMELDDRNQPTGRWVYYREYLAGGLPAREHAKAMLMREPVKPRAVGGAPSEDQWRNEFRQSGLTISRPPISEVEVGINRVYAAHALGEILVFDNLKMYLEQKRTYARKVDPNGNTTEFIEDKETFHIMDCERYLVSRLKGPQVEVGLR